MTPPRRREAPRREGPAPAPSRGTHTTAWLLAIAALALVSWHRALGTYFAQDDFHFLRLAAERTPVGVLTWRPLSTRLHFSVLHGLFGLAPVPFHVVNLALIAAAACALFALVARRAPAWAAGMAALAFVTSPIAFDAVHWASGAADLWCVACLALAALMVDGRPGPRSAWLGALAFVAAVESKEVAVGVVPVLAAWMLWRHRRHAVLPVLCVLSASALALAQALRSFETGAGGAYALAPGAVVGNLAAYLVALLFSPTAYRYASDAAWAHQGWIAITGGTLAVALAVALWRARRLDATLAAALALGALAPVLVLGRQLYLYYATVAACAFWAALALAAGRLRARARWAAVAGAAAVVVSNVAGIQMRERATLDLAPLPADFVLRRARLAANVVADVKAQRAALRPRVLFVGRQAVRAAIGRPPSQHDTGPPVDPYWDHDVRTAIADGGALKLLGDSVTDVTFASTVRREDRDHAIASYSADGHVTLTSFDAYAGVPDTNAAVTVEACLQRAAAYLERHMGEMAVEELRRALEIEPRNATVLLDLGTVAASLHDTTAAITALRAALDVAPEDADARFNLGLLLWRTGERAAASSTWAPLVRSAPDSPNARAVRDLLSGAAR